MKFLEVKTSTKELEKEIKNKWRWEWLSEKDETGLLYEKWLKKPDIAGVAFCVPCGKTINYKSNGKRLLKQHTCDSTHKKKLRIVKSNQMSSKDWTLDCKVYVGEIGYGAAKQELEDMFGKFGPLKNVWVARNPPGFAFVEFEDPRDARDACDSLDGTRINGRRARVEMSSGKSRWGSRGPPVRRGGGGGGHRGTRDRPRGRSRSRSPYSRRRSASPYYSRRRSPSPRRRYSRSRSPRDRSPRDRSPAARRSPEVRARSSDKDRDRSPYDEAEDRK